MESDSNNPSLVEDDLLPSPIWLKAKVNKKSILINCSHCFLSFNSERDLGLHNFNNAEAIVSSQKNQDSHISSLDEEDLSED